MSALDDLKRRAREAQSVEELSAILVETVNLGREDGKREAHRIRGWARYPLSEAAAALGVTADTLRQQIHNGAMKGEKIGPIWMVSEQEVERYAKEHKR